MYLLYGPKPIDSNEIYKSIYFISRVTGLSENKIKIMLADREPDHPWSHWQQSSPKSVWLMSTSTSFAIGRLCDDRDTWVSMRVLTTSNASTQASSWVERLSEGFTKPKRCAFAKFQSNQKPREKRSLIAAISCWPFCHNWLNSNTLIFLSTSSTKPCTLSMTVWTVYGHRKETWFA